MLLQHPEGGREREGTWGTLSHTAALQPQPWGATTSVLPLLGLLPETQGRDMCFSLGSKILQVLYLKHLPRIAPPCISLLHGWKIKNKQES